MHTVLSHPGLLAGGIYCLLTMVVYWFIMLRDGAPFTAKGLNVLAYAGILLSPVLITFALIKALFSMAKGKFE